MDTRLCSSACGIECCHPGSGSSGYQYWEQEESLEEVTITHPPALSFGGSTTETSEAVLWTSGTTPANESLLLDLIKQKDFIELGKLLEKNAELPSVEIYFQDCEICNKSNSRLVVRRAIQSSKGGLQFTDTSQIILQPKDSVLLLNQLRFIGN